MLSYLFEQISKRAGKDTSAVAVGRQQLVSLSVAVKQTGGRQLFFWRADTLLVCVSLSVCLSVCVSVVSF